MRQVKFVVLGTFLLFLGTGLCGTMAGCGDGSDTSQVTATPEARAPISRFRKA